MKCGHNFWAIGKDYFAIAACPVLQKKDPRRGGGPKKERRVDAAQMKGGGRESFGALVPRGR